MDATNTHHVPSGHKTEPQVNDLVAELEREVGITDVALPPAGATIQDYQKAYMEAEQNLFKMRGIVRELQMRCRELEVQLGSTRRPHKSVPKDVQLHGLDITILGRKYCVLIAPWLDTTIEVISQRPPIDYHSQHRYVSDATNQQAAKAELFDHIPPNLHKLMGYNAFGDTFRTAIQTQRANIVHSARAVVHILFPTIPSDLLILTRGCDRVLNPKVQRLLGYDGRRKYQPLPPVLYPPGQEKQGSMVFCSPTLLRLGRVILFGQSSLTSTATFRPHPNSTGKKWGTVEVSSGYIAFVAIVIIYLLSPNVNFQERGMESQITYRALFNRYKKLIISSIGSARGKAFFKLWNDYIFGPSTAVPGNDNIFGPSTAVPGNDNNLDKVDELNDVFDNALNALQNESSEDKGDDELLHNQRDNNDNNENDNDNDITRDASNINDMRGRNDVAHSTVTPHSLSSQHPTSPSLVPINDCTIACTNELNVNPKSIEQAAPPQQMRLRLPPCHAPASNARGRRMASRRSAA
ncbi:hypothetical protein QCA50_020008 [Cerrena zonata]|uniref:Uncharacterized protein n=1 Tax=Cerrena zonata TaxID=2478898 RepID=A0AAW0FHH8_9APHY